MPEIKKDEDKKVQERIPMKDESTVYALGSNLYKRFTRWRDDKRSIEEQWLKNLRAYNSVYEQDVLAKISPNGSRQYIGITRMKTTAAYSRLVDIFFPNTGHKFWTVKATPYPVLNKNTWSTEDLSDQEGNPLTDDQVIDEATARMNTRIEDQLVESDGDTLIRAAIKDACILGSGVIKAGMVKVETKENWVMSEEGFALVKEDDIVPGIEQPSPFDIYFDINASSPDSSIGTYHRHVLNKEEVMALKRHAGFRENVIDELIIDYPSGNHYREHHEIERQSLGNVNSFGNSGYYEVLEYWGYVDGRDLSDAGVRVPEDKMTQGYMANVWISGHKVIKLQIDESINKGKKFFVFPYEQVTNQLWGVGIPEIMYDSAEVLNAAFRRLLDDVARSGVQLEINVERLDDRSVANANKIDPWDIWYRTGGDDAYPAITVHRIPSNAGELIQVVEMVRRFIDDETNLPSLLHGSNKQGESGVTDTAAGMSMLMGAAQVVIKSVVKNIDDFLVKPLIRTYYNFNMEWSEDNDIKGDMKVHALGSSILIAREVQNRNMIEFLGITAGESDAGLVKRPSILRSIAVNMGFDSDDVIKSDKELAIEAANPDPMQVKLQELALEKAELENAEIQSRIAVNESEELKNLAEAEYKPEFLRQRRIKLAEDIKSAREERKINKKEAGGSDKPGKSSPSPKLKPVKILNE